MELQLNADFSDFQRQCQEIKSLALEAGNIPEHILQELRALVDDMGEELALSSLMAASRAGDYIIKIRFREGGRYDRCITALRAFCNGR